MKNTKPLALLLVICITFLALVSCQALNTQSGNKTEEQYECGKRAYDELVVASDLCEKVGDVVYGSWYFAIYEADDCSSYNVVSEFADEIGVSAEAVYAAANDVFGISSARVYSYLEDFQYAVPIAIATLEQNGTIAELDVALSNAKAELKTMTQKYSDYSEYPTLKSLYSKVDSYATFIKDPTGSFQQLKSTIENYENDIRTYKSDLSFIFEE